MFCYTFWRTHHRFVVIIVCVCVFFCVFYFYFSRHGLVDKSTAVLVGVSNGMGWNGMTWDGMGMRHSR